LINLLGIALDMPKPSVTDLATGNSFSKREVVDLTAESSPLHRQVIDLTVEPLVNAGPGLHPVPHGLALQRVSATSRLGVVSNTYAVCDMRDLHAC
jgi:hypothetical protein